jgi:hypothetical protein
VIAEFIVMDGELSVPVKLPLPVQDLNKHHTFAVAVRVIFCHAFHHPPFTLTVPCTLWV